MGADRRKLWALQGTTVLFWASLYVYVPYLSPYLSSLGMSASLIGYISSAYGAAMLVARIPIGVIADRLGKQKCFVLLGVLCAALSAVGMQLSENPVTILLFRFLSGIAAAAWVSFVTLYSSYFQREQTTQAVASLNMYASLGRVAAAGIGALSATAFGFRGVFLSGGVLGVTALLAGGFTRDLSEKSGESIQITRLLQVGKEKCQLFASLFGALNQMIAYATTYTFTNTLAQRIGAGRMELAALQAITSVAGILAPLLLSTRLSRYLSEHFIVTLSFAMLAVSQILFPFCRGFLTLYALQFLSGIGLGLGMVVLMALSIRDISAEKRSTAMGYYQAVYSLGLVLGPVIMGYLVQYLGYTAAYIVIGLISAAAALCYIVCAYGKLNRANRKKKRL